MTRWTRGRVALAALLVVFLSGLALAQELTTGIIEGVVKDDKGNPIAQATVSVEGKQGTRTATTDAEGRFNIRSLPAGSYTVKAEAQGFGTVVQSDVVVNVSKRTQVPFKLSTGRVETVTVTSEAPIVDMKNTTVGATVSVNNMVDYLPLGRNFTAMFTLSPGVVSGLQSGAGNYSISGSSGLENSYLVDGVNITNSGYGGIGSYNRVYGSLGSGVTNDFIDQVEVKEAGFEAEFGQATGGVVNAVVKSGGNKLSGQVSIYGQPTSFESERKLTALFPDDDPIKSRQQYDVGLSLGGPFIKDKLFWFAAYNPVQTKTVIERTALDPTIPAGRTAERTRDNDNYAAKFSWYVTPNHRIEATAFGDPSKGKYGAQRDAAVRRDGEDGFSTIDYGGNNASVKYAGALTSNFFVDALVARHKSKLKEDAKDLYEITNFNVTGGLDTGGLGFAPDTDESVDQYALKLTYVIGNHEIKGGWQQDKVSYTESGAQTGPTFTQKLPVGVLDSGSGDYFWDGTYYDYQSTTGAYLYQQANPAAGGADVFTVQRSRSSPLAVLTHNTETNFFLQDTWSITPRWTLRAGVRYTKEYVAGGAPFVLPFSFVQVDSLVDPTIPTVFDPEAVTFPKEWSPRVGLTWDVQGDGRHKLYANYSKMVQRLTQDLAYRAFSNEVDISQNWLDSNLTQQFPDTSCPTLTDPDAVCQGILNVSGSSPTQVWKDTKLPYTQEYLLGYTRELNENMSVDLRYIHRQIGRVIEDFSYVPQESIANRYWGPLRFIPEVAGGPAPTFNPFPAYQVDAFGDYVLGNPSVNSGSAIAELGGGGYPDFPKPRRDYDAFEVIFNKRFSDNWVGWVSYRYGQLIGNYEGLIRNDTGQDDPNITSLYDFPDTPLMHGQFIAGPLNADVKHNLKAFATYQFKNGLSVGAALNWASGVPRFPSLVHPNDFYQLPESGEVPGTSPVYASWYQTYVIATGLPQGDPFLVLSHGIGAAPSEQADGTEVVNGQFVFHPYSAPDPLTDGIVDRPLVNARFGTSQFLYNYTTVKRDFGGRTPDLTTIDVHLSYNIKTGWKNSNLNLGFDMFNVFNTQEGDTWNDVLEENQAQPNPNFGRPLTFGAPRTARVSLKWSF